MLLFIFNLLSICLDEEQEITEGNTKINHRRKRDNGEKLFNTSKSTKEKGPVNFFFNDSSDSEHENINYRQHKRSGGQLEIPQYNEIVRMEH